jgi:xanthine dehydrogenase accessory factor
MNCQPLAADIHRAIVEFAAGGRAFAMAVILKTTGSAPREAGTKALIESNGSIHGTIGGGMVEAETQRLAVEAIRSGRPLVFDFALGGSDAQADRPLCGGSMRVLVDPTVAGHRAVYARAAEAYRRRERGALVTTVRMAPLPQTAVQWFPRECIPADMGFPGAEAVRAALAGETPQLLVHDLPQEGAHLEVLVEPLILPPLLVIAGGGHVGQALALQAGLVGFQVVVMEDRSEFADPALYPPGVVTRCGDIDRELAGFPVAGDTYIAVVTRGHQHDKGALAACIHKPAAYIGMIGSKRKVALLRKDLLESGAATEEELGRVYAPIGLDIGAETVPEIATSIVAQLIAVRRKGISPRMPTG